MAQADSTCWTIIKAAAAGQAEERELFARYYAPVIRAYLAARWRTSPHQKEIDDALQDVFLECFRQGGVLERADRERPGGFRPFLYGVARNVALRIETAKARRREVAPHPEVALDDLAGNDESLSRIFDRAWAKALMREAADRQTERARILGTEAIRRVELLRLRFQEGLPIRDIARRWQTDAAQLHQSYLKARQEFKSALLDVIAFHHPGNSFEMQKECSDLLVLLSSQAQ